MTFLSWLTLVDICALGAMSPGPSLAVILQNRLQRDLRAALIAGWFHAAGIFFWALAAGSTLGILFHRFPAIKVFLTLAGAVFLSYLAIKSWKSKSDDNGKHSNQLPAAWVAGLSISILIALMAMLGGAGSLWGPIIGAGVLIPLKSYLKEWLGATAGLAGIDLTIYAVIIMLISAFEPRGIWGIVEKVRRRKHT